MNNSRYLSFLLHLLCWLIFFSLVLYFIDMPGDSQSPDQNFFDLPHLVFYTVFPFIFYANLGFLFPQLFLRKKYTGYFIVMLLIFAAEIYLQPFDRLMSVSSGRREEKAPPPPKPAEQNTRRRPPVDRRAGPEGNGNPRIDIMSIILFVVTWSLSSGIAIFRQWRTTEKRALRAEADKAKAELSFLRAQINPHFLFNTLNNIYSMAVTKNDATADSIMKLSNIMRYVTDEGKENFVMLEDEIDCLRDYIDLHRIRLGNKTEVRFIVKGEPALKKVVPLLFMTFVENAFKYGTSNHQDSLIEIQLLVQNDKILFTCKNSLFAKTEMTERTGIGIQNARQRLTSLYPLNHKLEISQTNSFFNVQLELIFPQIKDK